jgi:site-specific DNA recombinase
LDVLLFGFVLGGRCLEPEAIVPGFEDRTERERDEALLSLLREAMVTREEVLSASDMTIAEIAASSGRCRKRMSRLFRLSWTAPDFIDAVLAGRQPASLSPRSLLAVDLPLDWESQKAALGF